MTFIDGMKQLLNDEQTNLFTQSQLIRQSRPSSGSCTRLKRTVLIKAADLKLNVLIDKLMTS